MRANVRHAGGDRSHLFTTFRGRVDGSDRLGTARSALQRGRQPTPNRGSKPPATATIQGARMAWRARVGRGRLTLDPGILTRPSVADWGGCRPRPGSGRQTGESGGGSWRQRVLWESKRWRAVGLTPYISRTRLARRVAIPIPSPTSAGHLLPPDATAARGGAGAVRRMRAMRRAQCSQADASGSSQNAQKANERGRSGNEGRHPRRRH